MMTDVILPGSTIGVLGSGQLGRMFGIAARQMGYRVHTYSPETDTPLGQVADREVMGAYEDVEALREFAKGVHVITYEFENIPLIAPTTVSHDVPVRPAGMVLHTTQHRIREKTFLRESGFPVAPFSVVLRSEDLPTAIKKIGGCGVLKTAGFGYDGKGQGRVNSLKEAQDLFQKIGGQEAVLEAFVDFDCEISVVAARGLHGEFSAYDPFLNEHRNHILDVTSFPAPVSSDLQKKAIALTRDVMEKLNVVGVLCVEMFQTKEGALLINELAPRPHNSGHLTIDACVTSQFEQQVRAVCGLPLGSTRCLSPAAMANLMGDLWNHGEPDWSAVCSHPEVKLHLYGKLTPAPGRKMGHLTALANSVSGAKDRVLQARNELRGGI